MFTPEFIFLVMLVLVAVTTEALRTQLPYNYAPDVPRVSLPDVKDVPKPFRVIWNSPDFPCWGKRIDFGLDKYGIESNGKRWLGDTISLYYSVGHWPRINLKNRTQWMDGGLPQYGNMTAHLESFMRIIPRDTTPQAFGYGVIDMEVWRPLLETSYGWLEYYKQIQIDEMSRLYPNVSAKERWDLALKIWNSPARSMMENALKLAKALRPRRRWGYYGYPEFSSYGLANDRLAWLWNITTAFYPSIYNYNLSQPLDYVERRQVKVISEAFRVRALYGDPDAPIMVYTLLRSTQMGQLQGDLLDLAVTMPIDMGVDGIVLWGSSNDYHGNSTEKCLQTQSYVRTTLGPKIQALLDRMTQCSAYLCGAKGRCVHRKYAEKVMYLKDRGVLTSSHKRVTPAPKRPSFANDFLADYFNYNYVCQCYTGWTGHRCRQSYYD